MTRDMIDAVLAAEGRYSLPYRLHATQAQFHAAYPQAGAFFELKRKILAGEAIKDFGRQAGLAR